MLVKTLKYGAYLLIGDRIKLTFTKKKGKQVKVTIIAPKNMAILREEIYKNNL